MDEFLRRLDPSKITSAFPLMALCLILDALVVWVGIKGDIGINAWHVTLLVGLNLLAVVLFVTIVGRHKNDVHDDESSVAQATLRQLVESSKLPMYLADEKFHIVCLNRELTHFLGVHGDAILGEPVATLVEEFGKIVIDDPPGTRDEFLALQHEFTRNRRLPAQDAEVTVDVDRSLRPPFNLEGKYRVWIHAHELTRPEQERPFGTFVIYRPQAVED